LPTYIGGDMDKEAKLLVFKTTRRDLAITGTSRLLTGWDAFLDTLDAAVSAYNDRPHSALPRIRDPQIARTRHMTPNEMWRLKCDGFEPVIPDTAELDDMFRPYVMRRTRRALVEWLGNSYFDAALEAFDGRDVIVGYDIRDASRVHVREIAEIDGERVPGRLIAIARFEGHRTRYVPITAERAAMERRQKGRLARLDTKKAVIEQELRPSALFEAAPVAAPPVLSTAEIVPVAVPVTTGGRPHFRDDVQFARWLTANPDQATASDAALAADLINTPSSQELLRMSGIDLVALRSIARSGRAAGAA
jgi:putative transposase